jgi:hypothetical protein
VVLALSLPRVAGAAAAGAVVGENAMLDETTAVARAVAAARRSTAGIGFQRRLVDTPAALTAAAAAAQSALSSRELEIDGQMLQRLGLLPAGVDYRALLAGALGPQRAAFYDPGVRRLYVPSWIDLREQRPLLAHEIAHALQDQRIGLRRFLGLRPDGRRGLDFDAQLARQALIEGDASVLAMEATDPRARFPPPRELAEAVEKMRVALLEPPVNPAATPPAPSFIRELLGFPYVEGFAFVARLRGAGSWASIDGVWASPPESTAQILHPEKYDRHQSPLPVQVSPLASLGDGYQVARTDTLGELMVRLWLSSQGDAGARSDPPAGIPRDLAERAAAGWRGDRIAVYLPAAAEQSVVLAWLTAWESTADADDFLQVASRRLAALATAENVPGLPAAPAPPLAADRPAVFTDRSSGAAFAIQRRSQWVALVLGAPEAAARPALTAMLEGRQAGERSLPAAAGARKATPVRSRSVRKPGG